MKLYFWYTECYVSCILNNCSPNDVYFRHELIFSIISGQYLPSSAGPPDRVTVCKGASISVACGSDSIIAVADIQYGTKLTTTCGLGNTSAGCCDYDSGDCLTAYTSSTAQGLCNGRELCTFGHDISGTCGLANYPVLNHYLTMQYYCLLGKLYASSHQIGDNRKRSQ